jgi:hypothetical protein
VILCRHGTAEVLETTRRWMTGIELALNETKTRVCSARPSKKALASIRDKIRRRLRPGNQAPWEEVVRALNRTVRG